MYRGPVAPQPGHFGSDLRALLGGLSRIVQLLFTGVPVITFLGSMSRFLWKFAGYLGCAAARTLPGLGDLATAEEVWSRSSVAWKRVRMASVLAIGLVGLRIYLRKRRIQSEENWESASEAEEMEVDVLPPIETIKSEEGHQPSPYPQFNQYSEDMWNHY